MLQDEELIEIISHETAISVTKSTGTQVAYFLYPEFEIHVNPCQ
ncbi:hypothetical protein [Pseudolactococcus hodotermopsidis]|nr:hypothetical protein [Lactococcus hodotermopsidis]